MTQAIEITAAFVAGVIVARLYWASLISKAKSVGRGKEDLKGLLAPWRLGIGLLGLST